MAFWGPPAASAVRAIPPIVRMRDGRVEASSVGYRPKAQLLAQPGL